MPTTKRTFFQRTTPGDRARERVARKEAEAAARRVEEQELKLKEIQRARGSLI